MLFDPRARHLYELRPDAAALWPALDGEASLDQLGHELADVSDVPFAEATVLLHGILEPLVAAGLVQLLQVEE